MTKTSSATWGSIDGAFVLYVQYDDSKVSELKFPHISEGIGGSGASRSGFLLPTLNNSIPSVFPDQITVRYPTVNIRCLNWFDIVNLYSIYLYFCRKFCWFKFIFFFLFSAWQFNTSSDFMDSSGSKCFFPSTVGSKTS